MGPDIHICPIFLTGYPATRCIFSETIPEVYSHNFRYPLKMLLEAAKEYRRISNTKHITFEYLLLKDVNDSREDAIQLVRLLHGLACKVNLIRYNDWPMSRFARTSEDRVNAFAFELKKRGIMATVRQSKGDDIFAACGQLKTQIIS